MSNSTELIIPEEIRPVGLVVDACQRCGGIFGENGLKRSATAPSFCQSCAKAERGLAVAAKQSNSDWLTIAFEAGIPLWEQQPNETVDEYDMWLAFRNCWPDARPTVTKVASILNVPAATVQRAYNRWTWGARMQAWIREVTADKTAELRSAKRKMVDDHIRLGEKMRAKMLTAVDMLDPEDVTPNELVSLLKETQRLEASSRDMLDEIEAATASDIDNMPAGLFEEEQQKGEDGASNLSLDDMAEVVSILQAAGVVDENGNKRIGIKKTTTIEAVSEF